MKRQTDSKIREYSFPIPEHLFKVKGLHGKAQVAALAYIAHRIELNPRWKFNPVEVATVVGIHRTTAYRLLCGFVKKDILRDNGVKRIDIPEKLQVHGLTHFMVKEFTANAYVVHALFYKKCVSQTPNLQPTILNQNSTLIAVEPPKVIKKDYPAWLLALPYWRAHPVMLLLDRNLEELNRLDSIDQQCWDNWVSALRHSLTFFNEVPPNNSTER